MLYLAYVLNTLVMVALLYGAYRLIRRSIRTAKKDLVDAGLFEYYVIVKDVLLTAGVLVLLALLVGVFGFATADKYFATNKVVNWSNAQQTAVAAAKPGDIFGVAFMDGRNKTSVSWVLIDSIAPGPNKMDIWTVHLHKTLIGDPDGENIAFGGKNPGVDVQPADFTRGPYTIGVTAGNLTPMNSELPDKLGERGIHIWMLPGGVTK